MDFIYYMLLKIAKNYSPYPKGTRKYIASYLLLLIAGTYYISVILLLAILFSKYQMKFIQTRYFDISTIITGLFWIILIFARYISEKKANKVINKYQNNKINEKYYLLILIVFCLLGYIILYIIATFYNKTLIT